MIFTAHQLQERFREQRLPLYTAFIDATKAFDAIDCLALWNILSSYGWHDNYIQILRLLQGGMSLTVPSNREPFTLEPGVKQGCLIAPMLLAIFTAAILHLTG